MKTKIPHLILAGLFGTAIASQGALVIYYEEDFAPAVVPDGTGSTSPVY
jgi:hypothetical protein